MPEAAFACCYFIFAILFAIMNYIFQDVAHRSQMREAVVSRYIDLPYSFKPEKFYSDIAVPEDLHDWLQTTFLQVTFNERPVNGDPRGFCADVESDKCDIAQGGCDSDDECMTGLTCTDKRTLVEGVMVNGGYWDKHELVDWCNYLGTPIDLFRSGDAIGGPEYQNCSTDVNSLLTDPSSPGPCCWDTKSGAYISVLQNASSPSQALPSYGVWGRGNCPSFLGVATNCCSKNVTGPLTPEESARIEADAVDIRPVTVGNFNRILMVRFTMKRFQTEGESGNKAFQGIMPSVIRSSGGPLDANKDNSKREDKTSFESGFSWQTSPYVWNKSESYHKSGGYVEKINPAFGKDNMGVVLDRIQYDGFFDNKLAIFVLDMMFYNGNLETFMYVSIKFAFTPAGTCHKDIEVMFLNLSSGDMGGPFAFAKMIELFLLIPLVALFILLELKKCCIDNKPYVHFVQGFPNTSIDALSLILCAFVLGMNYFVQMTSTYKDFEFSDNPEIVVHFEDFLKLIDLQSIVAWQVYFTAINLLMIFFRAVVMITQLEDNLGLIVNTLGKAMVPMAYFTLSFFCLLMGFVSFAYFTFGSKPQVTGMPTFLMAFYRVFAMLLGQQNFTGLEEVDPLMALFFYFAFYIMVLFVMLNMFISILLSGYDVCIFELNEKRKNATQKPKSIPRRIYEEITQEIFGKVIQFAKSCGIIIWKVLRAFLVGMLSCFKECYNSCCDCGCSLPGRQKVASVFAALKRPGVVHPDRMFQSERKIAKDLAKRAKSLEGILREYPEVSVKVLDARKKVDEMLYRTSAIENVTMDDVEDLKKLDIELEDRLDEGPDIAPFAERLATLSFMGIFVTMLIIMTRGEDAFWLARSTHSPAVDGEWIDTKPLRLGTFAGIQNMEEVGQWADILAERMYSHVECIGKKDLNGDGILDDVPLADCNPGDPALHLTQKVNHWNGGFLNTTFVRVTIQPACFILNKEDRWVHGTKYLRSIHGSGSCVFDNCFDKAYKKEGNCLNSFGETLDPNRIPVGNFRGADPSQHSYYNFSEAKKLGPYRLTGGLAVSLGRTLDDAKTALKNLRDDLWFTRNSASVVFDYITYNGNLDLFAHNVIGFNLVEAGTIKTEEVIRIFPLNLTDGGGWYQSLRVLVMVLFFIYVVFVIGFLCQMCFELGEEHKKGKRRGRSKWSPAFVFEYYNWKHVWNRTDTLSLGLTVVSVVIYITFIVDTFRNEFKFATDPNEKYVVPVSAASEFGMVKKSDPTTYIEQDWFLFYMFEQIGGTYDFYLNLAAVNAFFIAIKVVKYANVIPKFKIYASTLGAGSERMMYFGIVIGLLLFGWSLFFLVVFGVYERDLSDIMSAVSTCFQWILGDFDLSRLLHANELAAIIFFCIFQLMMYFVCINMFLATMLNTYSETVGKMEIEREKFQQKREREHGFIEVEYQDKTEMMKDLQCEKDDHHDKLWVWKVSVGGKAELLNVCGGGQPKPGETDGGDLVVRANGKSIQSYFSPDAYKATQILENVAKGAQDTEEDAIRIVFKVSPRRNTGALQKIFPCLALARGEQTAKVSVPYGVKTFWRRHGAVTWLNEDFWKQQRNPSGHKEAVDDKGEKPAEEKEGAPPPGGGGGGGGDEVDVAAENADSSSQTEEKTVKSRVKKKLDSWLFSRAALDKTGAEIPNAFDIQLFDEKTKKKGEDEHQPDNDENREKDDMDVDVLRAKIEEFEIQGDEVWLDCLMTQIEAEMEDDCLVTEVLRTAEMTETHKGKGPQNKDALNVFWRMASDILNILECKARQRWYNCLREESQTRSDMFRQQNSILHDYACELEGKFSEIMQKINVFKAKKEQMITKLAGLLDQKAYQHLDTSGEPRTNDHMKRLTTPWPDAMVGGMAPLTNF